MATAEHVQVMEKAADEVVNTVVDPGTSIAPRRYFTTGDIADYTGLTQGQISKTARDPNSWLALFVVCAGKGEHCRFVDPTGWLLKLWCGFRRVKRSFPGATRNQVFKAFRIIGLEKGKPRRRLLTQREAGRIGTRARGNLSSAVTAEA